MNDDDDDDDDDDDNISVAQVYQLDNFQPSRVALTDLYANMRLPSHKSLIFQAQHSKRKKKETKNPPP